MQCPYCEAYGSKVIDSRSSEGGCSIRRRRECLKCGGRFTSYERVEKTGRLMVIKKDGSRVPFASQKILIGIQAACGKRPIPEERKLQIVREVEETVYRLHEREVQSMEIGQLVAGLLRTTDQIAFVRYASEYQSFDSLEDVEETIKELKDMPPPVEGQNELFPSE